MRVLITGAAGRLGGEIARQAKEAGHQLRLVDRRFTKDLPEPIQLANLLDQHACYPLVEDIDAVIHLANYSHSSHGSAQTVYGENVQMNINLFQAAVDMGVKRLIFASSVQVISGERRVGDVGSKPSCLSYLPIDSQTPVCAQNPYALSKAATEEMLKYLCQVHDVSAVALRIPHTNSPARLVGYRMRHPKSIKDLYPGGEADEGFAYLKRDNAADLMVRLLSAELEGYRQFFAAAPDNILGWPTKEVIETFYPEVALKKPMDQMDSLVDCSDLKELLGWEAEPLTKEEVEAGRWQ